MYPAGFNIKISGHTSRQASQRVHRLRSMVGVGDIWGRILFPECWTTKLRFLDLSHTLSKEASAKLENTVTLAQAGVQKSLQRLDSRLRGNDVQGLLQEVQRLTHRFTLPQQPLILSIKICPASEESGTSNRHHNNPRWYWLHPAWFRSFRYHNKTV